MCCGEYSPSRGWCILWQRLGSHHICCTLCCSMPVLELCIDSFLMQHPGLQSGLSRKVSDHKAEDPCSQLAHTDIVCASGDRQFMVQISERCLVLCTVFQSLCVAALVFSARPFSAEDFFGKQFFCQVESTAVASRKETAVWVFKFFCHLCRGLVLV